MDTHRLYRLFNLVKIHRKFTIIIAVFIIVVCAAYLNPGPLYFRENVDNYYTKQLQIVKEKLIVFKTLGKKKVSLEILQQQFYQSRLAYKKLAVLTEYFNIYETKFLNYPAIDRIEEDNPDKTIHPEGFQAVTHGRVLLKSTNTSVEGRLIQRFSEEHYRVKEEIGRAHV